MNNEEFDYHPRYICKREDCIIRNGYTIVNPNIIYDAIIHFGKYKGKKLRELPSDYQKWICSHFDNGILRRWIQICLTNGEYTTPIEDQSRC